MKGEENRSPASAGGPSGGPEVNEGRTIIARTIRDATTHWLDEGIVPTIRAIGDGQCEEFATEVMERLRRIDPDTASGTTFGYTEDWWLRELGEHGVDMDGAVCFEADIPRLRAEGAPLPLDISDLDLSLLIGGATHVWLRWNDLHFDATAPDGRTHFLLMPFFADQIAGYRADPERNSA